MRMHTIRLPAAFAAITTPELQAVRCTRKELVRHQDNMDVSEMHPIFFNQETRGDIFFHRHQTPHFGVEEVLAHNHNPILVHFCILPLTYQDHVRNLQLPVVMIAYEGGRGWMTERGGMFSMVVEVAPHHLHEMIHQMLGNIYDQLHRNSNRGGGGGYDYDGNRRWPPGIRVDPNYDAFDDMLEQFDEPPPPPRPRRGRHSRQEVAPAGGEPASTGAGAAAATVPSRPSERVALALARDYINEREICPITQDTIQHGRVAVTGCLCVFQAEALEGANTHQCPTCRTSLVFRVVEVQVKPPPP